MNVEVPDLESGYGIFILVGDNGSGKSQILQKMATDLIRIGRPVFAIANTAHHRFPRYASTGYRLLVPAAVQHSPEKVIKKVLKGDSEKFFYTIGKVLEYCGFRPTLRIRVEFPDDVFWTNSANDFQGYLKTTEAFTSQELFDIEVAIAPFLYGSRNGSEQNVYFDSSYSRSRQFDLLDILRFETRLKKAGVITDIEFLAYKGESVFPLRSASSGEISLLSTYISLAANIEEGTVILVDEPENSLHPHWQTEYCKRLLDLFHWYRPTMVMATHSPILVSAATSDAEPAKVLRVENGRLEKNVDSIKSVEGTLWNTFETLAPANHWLSESLVSILDQLSKKEITMDDVMNSILKFRYQSYDEKQKDFLDDFVRLAQQVSRGEITDTSETGAD